jgi:predicted DNA-binding protein (MmcQ/YjbR family)
MANKSLKSTVKNFQLTEKKKPHVLKSKSFSDAENYDHDFIYNADETGLNCKSLPKRSLASKREIITPGYKMNKKRVIIMVHTN